MGKQTLVVKFARKGSGNKLVDNPHRKVTGHVLPVANTKCEKTGIKEEGPKLGAI